MSRAELQLLDRVSIGFGAKQRHATKGGSLA